MKAREVAGRRIEEQMRRASSRTTEYIARRYGRHFPMWIGCGYPKSGTVWLCQLLSNYLGVPYPQNYAFPIAMQSVLHAHWRFHEGLPRTAYIYRDGRDVMVSLYFYNMRAITEARHPRQAQRLRAKYERVLGRRFDPADIRRHLARFVDVEMRKPSHVNVSWPDHIRDWHGGNREQVSYVSYESLVTDTKQTLLDLVTSLTDEPGDPERASLAVDRYDFARGAGREPGAEDRSSFMRKGVVGDWSNHFTREAGEVFDHHAGSALSHLGYIDRSRWFDALPTQ